MHRTLDVTRQQADVDDLRWGGSKTAPAVAFFAGHARKYRSLSSRSLRQPLAWRTNNTSKLGCQDFRNRLRALCLLGGRAGGAEMSSDRRNDLNAERAEDAEIPSK